MYNEVQIWKKYGSYLSGVRCIRRSYPKATFDHFINACEGQFGGWSRQALLNAWNLGA